MQGHSNKYHDGFLGHAYVGEWVNLGAGTQNSDLRNDYGEVRMTVNGRTVNTGRTKVGCFVGDHTKTGLGTLLNTGTNVGIFCNLLPTGGLLPKYVPSFTSVWNGALVENVDLAALLTTADAVMRRRGRTLSEAERGLYRAADGPDGGCAAAGDPGSGCEAIAAERVNGQTGTQLFSRRPPPRWYNAPTRGGVCHANPRLDSR